MCECGGVGSVFVMEYVVCVSVGGGRVCVCSGVWCDVCVSVGG